MRPLHPLLLVFALSTACKKEPPPLPPTPFSKTTASTPAPGAPRKHALVPPAATAAPVRPKAGPPPAAGKGNVSGVVRYDGKPVASIDVKLCEKFTSIGFGGCSGVFHLARTDADGSYLLRDIPPGMYQALLVRLFDSGTWVYASADIFRARPYTVVAGTTIEASPSELYKRDLFLISPRAGARVAGPRPAMRWAAYAGAHHYFVTLSPEEPLGAKHDATRPSFRQINVDKPTFVPDKPLPPGRYRIFVAAMGVSAGNPKIAETENRMFIVADRADPERPDPTPPPPYPAPPTFETYKPAAGIGAVQGQVLYNARGVAGIEVKLCSLFNRYFGGCQGKVYRTKTDASGMYLFKDIPPMVYKGLTARVFKTRMVVFMTAGFAGLSEQSYPVEAGKTLVAAPTTLFKKDVKVLSPKKRASTDSTFEVKWAAYPGAAYYTFNIGSDYSAKVKPKQGSHAYNLLAVDKPSFVLDYPLESGGYNLYVIAYNAWGQKLSESDFVSFTVK